MSAGFVMGKDFFRKGAGMRTASDMSCLTPGLNIPNRDRSLTKRAIDDVALGSSKTSQTTSARNTKRIEIDLDDDDEGSAILVIIPDTPKDSQRRTTIGIRSPRGDREVVYPIPKIQLPEDSNEEDNDYIERDSSNEASNINSEKSDESDLDWKKSASVTGAERKKLEDLAKKMDASTRHSEDSLPASGRRKKGTTPRKGGKKKKPKGGELHDIVLQLQKEIQGLKLENKEQKSMITIQQDKLDTLRKEILTPEKQTPTYVNKDDRATVNDDIGITNLAKPEEKVEDIKDDKENSKKEEKNKDGDKNKEKLKDKDKTKSKGKVKSKKKDKDKSKNKEKDKSKKDKEKLKRQRKIRKMKGKRRKE